MEEPLKIEFGKDFLMGVRHVPKSKVPYPTVILYHGLTGDKSEGYRRFVRLSRLLCKKGMQVFRFDFRGHGDSSREFSDITLKDLIEDSRIIFEFVKNHDETNPEKIGIVARSICVPLYMGLKDDCKAVVLHAPAVYLDKVLERGWGVGLRYKRIPKIGYILNENFYDGAKGHSLLKSIKKVKAPILIVTGDEDEIVRLDEVEELYRMANEPKKLVVVKYADHRFERQEHERKVNTETIKWFQKYLLG